MRGLPLAHASEAGKSDGRSAGVTEAMSSYFVVSPQAHEVLQELPVLVLGDDIHGVACACAVEACGVEVGRGIAAAAAAVAAVEVAIVAAVQGGIGTEPGGLVAAAVVVGYRSRRDM